MKRIFQLLILAVAALGLSSCSTYVEERAYVSGRPHHVHGHSRPVYTQPVTYHSGSRFHSGRTASYRHRDSRRYDRNDRRDRYERQNVRYDRRDSDRRYYNRSRSSVDTRVRTTNVGLFR